MSERTIKALAELALRVDNLDVMRKFYEEVIGLELMQRFPKAAFFKIAEGYAGHTQALALFDRKEQEGYAGVSAARSTVDHFAFSIAAKDHDAEKARLEALGIEVRVAEHSWVHWRSLYVRDPEGNEVELVCYDPTVE